MGPEQSLSRESRGATRVLMEPYKLECVQSTRGVKNSLEGSTNVLRDPYELEGSERFQGGSIGVLRDPYKLKDTHSIH